MPVATADKTNRRWQALLPLLLFVLVGSAFFWNAMGDDLASSFVGCRVLASGGSAWLYSHDPVNFASISEADSLWQRLAVKAGYSGWLHPYVQTPLWAWLLRPLCNRLPWSLFKHVFLLLAMSSVAGCILSVARFWTPRLLNAFSLTLIALALSFSEPFLFAMELVQTHALLLLLTVAGLILAQNKRPVWAGLCVALAASVKITPGVLLVYWIACRRWKAAVSLVVWLIALMGITRWIAGSALFHEYTISMHRVSNVLLVAENNQSLASWYMDRFFASDEIFDVNTFPLPNALRIVSLICMVTLTAVGGLLDLRSERLRPASAESKRSCGAGLALVAMTAFAPIAWTHYYIVLVIPAMMLVDVALDSAGLRRWILIGGVIVIAVLQYRPFTPDVVHMELSDYALVRAAFYSALLTIGGLLFACVTQRETLESDVRIRGESIL